MSQTRATEKARADFESDCAALAADPAHAEVLRVRVATCPTCQGWVYQGAYPHCETSKGSQKEIRACLAAGLTISIITLAEAQKLAYCQCA